MNADQSSSSLDPERERVRLVAVEVEPESGGSSARVRVTLEAGDEQATVIRGGEAESVGAPLRPVVEATLEGLSNLLAPAPGFEVLGVERVLAAGMDVVLVAVEAPSLGDRSLVGATPVEDRDGGWAAATATLDAVNRLLGRLARE